MPAVAFFVSPHGFGHAARASAVMLALLERWPDLRLEIFTRVPEWFFSETLRRAYGYHSLLTDIGMIQRTPLDEDLEETQRQLGDFLPFSEELLTGLAAELKRLDCRAVVCDISPLGIAAAHRAGLPAILLENFTWDWIYAGYLREAPGLAGAIEYLQQIFASADYHIQAEPVCAPLPQADLVVPPVGRPARTPAAALRQRIGVRDGQQIVLITLGGIATYLEVSDSLRFADDLFFVVPGGAAEERRLPNQLLLPHHSDFYHPDLLYASHAVVGKPGYSTLAEAYCAGVLFVYLPRPRFREYPILAEYIDRQVGGLAISELSFQRGDWIDALRLLLQRHTAQPRLSRGAQMVADFIMRV